MQQSALAVSESLVQSKPQADTTEGAFQEIPIIDLKELLNGGDQALRDVAERVKDACVNIGFFYVTNHGIPEVAMNVVLSEMKEFFSLPLETKMTLENKKNPSFMGYSSLLSGNNDPNGNGDMHEGFEFGWESIDASNVDDPRTVKNVWPAQSPKFRYAALEYYHAAVNLGRMLFPLFALALNLPSDWFSDKTQKASALMRLLHYPPQSGPADDRVIGIGAHTDWECFTILWQEPDIQALQVLNTNKEWIDAPPIPGALVVNLGDQLARWTNDTFKSTVHRAINRSGVRRYSIPLFFGTDNDVALEPIPGCTSEERPYRYEVITAGEYVRSRLEATYGH